MSVGDRNCSSCDHLLSLYRLLASALSSHHLKAFLMHTRILAPYYHTLHIILEWPPPLSDIHVMQSSISSPDLFPNSRLVKSLTTWTNHPVFCGHLKFHMSKTKLLSSTILPPESSTSLPPFTHTELTSDVSHHLTIITCINLSLWNWESPIFNDPWIVNGYFLHMQIGRITFTYPRRVGVAGSCNCLKALSNIFSCD